MPRRAGRRPEEGRDEVIAREVVARCLGATVERYEDGTSDSMPDGLIRYPDGATAPLEVVGDHLPAYNAQRTALEQRGHRRLTVEGLRWHWVVSIEGTADTRPVRRALPGLLRRAEALHPNSPWRAGRALRAGLVDEPRDNEDGPDDWERLGLFTATAYPDGQPGDVTLTSAPFAGFGLGPDAVTDWAEGVLTREGDVGRKLAAASLGPEGHAFVWVSISSPVPVQTALDIGAGGRLPTRDPVLPTGVTHLWVVSPYTSARSLAWFPDGGRRELPFRWPTDRPLAITQPA